MFQNFLFVNEIFLVHDEFFLEDVGICIAHALRVAFHKADNETIITEPPPYFQTLPLESYASHDLNLRLEEAYTILRERIDNCEEMGSGWVLDHFKCVDVQIAEMANPLCGNKKSDSSSEKEET